MNKPTLNVATDWTPSDDLIAMIQRNTGASPDFINDQVAEFVLYWQGRTFNPRFVVTSKFMQHIARQWKLHIAKPEQEPMPMVTNWEPTQTVIKDLAALGYHPRDWSHLLPGFRAYWIEMRERRNHWNATFIEHIQRVATKSNEKRTISLTMNELMNDDAQKEPAYESAEASKRRLNDTDW